MSPLVLLVPIVVLAGALAWLLIRAARLRRDAADARASLTGLGERSAAQRQQFDDIVRTLRAHPVLIAEVASEFAGTDSLGADADRRKDARRRSPRSRRVTSESAPPTRL